MDVLEMARCERADLADLLETLTPEQWSSPSLCSGWSVHDVVVHMVSYEEHGPRDLLGRWRRAGYSFGRLNDVALEEYRGMSPRESIAFLREHLEPRGATSRFGGRVGLADGLIHHQDIRRPLGLVRTIPPERLRCVLAFAILAPPLRGAWHARGVRLVADDLDWQWGRGPEARGPGEAVLMALVGRRGAAEELTGPGAATLRDRLG